MEETRVCTICGKEFPLTNEYFAWENKAVGKYHKRCKNCLNEYYRKHRLAVKDDDEHKARKKEAQAKYYQSHKSEIKEKLRVQNGRRYWGDEGFTERFGADVTVDANLKHYSEPLRDELLQKKNERRHTEHGRKQCCEYVKQYQREKRRNDPEYRAIEQVRNCLNKTFKRRGEIKSKRNVELTGKTSRELYAYLLQTFEETYGYPWNLQEPVHIDHIIPLTTATSKEDVEKLCHYTNLRLIKAEDNWKKNKRLDYQIGGASC